MELLNVSGILIENTTVSSSFLDRDVVVDFYLPKNVADPSQMSLLLVNDGQNMEELGMDELLETLYRTCRIKPLLCAAVHAGKDRKLEYGIANQPDYKGRGNKASQYTSFIVDELIPFIHKTYKVERFREMAFAGFSLGGLSAMDITWNHPSIFSIAAVFSGSFWWRTKSLASAEYSDERHRIMHQQVRHGEYKPGLRFFFQTGTLDEKMDRNNNGIIDSIDDTLDLIAELKQKGYTDEAIFYMEIEKGKHDFPTWKKAMPVFLEWGWGWDSR